jgi:hypothetical protein
MLERTTQRTYKAVLRGNYLEWLDEAPDYNEDRLVNVEVTILEESLPSKTSLRGQQMAIILKKLAETKVFSEIQDPISWQREERKDRLLPSREG